MLEAQLEEFQNENTKLVENQEKLQEFLKDANKKADILQSRREVELKSYEDNDYERLNIINSLDARIKDMESQNNNLKSPVQKAATYCETPTAFPEAPQQSLELENFRHDVKVVTSSLSVLVGIGLLFWRKYKKMETKW